jgi:hypothetical protein
VYHLEDVLGGGPVLPVVPHAHNVGYLGVQELGRELPMATPVAADPVTPNDVEDVRDQQGTISDSFSSASQKSAGSKNCRLPTEPCDCS